MIVEGNKMCCGMGFITGGPNEAIVVSGCLHSQPMIVVGGWAFVIPCVQKVQRISLNVMTIKVSSPKVYTTQGVLLSVTGIAQVRIHFRCRRVREWNCMWFISPSLRRAQSP